MGSIQRSYLSSCSVDEGDLLQTPLHSLRQRVATTSSMATSGGSLVHCAPSASKLGLCSLGEDQLHWPSAPATVHDLGAKGVASCIVLYNPCRCMVQHLHIRQ
eukprot:2341235-Amphidinium_carterae.1